MELICFFNKEISLGSIIFYIKTLKRCLFSDKEIFGEKKAGGLRTEQGEYLVDGVFVLRDAVSPKQLVPGLELDGNHVKVNLSMETNIPGLFACGDITGTPYQYIKAAGQGNVAALSAVAYLDAKKREAGKQ